MSSVLINRRKNKIKIVSNVVSDSADYGYDIILIAGQSNAVGRATPSNDTEMSASDATTIDITHPEVFQWGRTAPNNGKIILAKDPLEHVDAGGGSIGFGMTFARRYVENIAKSRRVLLVATAKGGSSVTTWHPSTGIYYTDAKARVEAALSSTGDPYATNRLVAILWLQGESDANMDPGEYMNRLSEMVAAFRTELSSPNVPFIAANIVRKTDLSFDPMRSLLATIPLSITNSAIVETSDLGSYDQLHYRANALRTIGHRMYEYYRLMTTEKPASLLYPSKIEYRVVADPATGTFRDAMGKKVVYLDDFPVSYGVITDSVRGAVIERVNNTSQQSLIVKDVPTKLEYTRALWIYYYKKVVGSTSTRNLVTSPNILVNGNISFQNLNIAGGDEGLRIGEDNTFDANTPYLLSNIMIPYDTWVHLTVVRRRNGQYRLYINGALMYHGTFAKTFIPRADSWVGIGNLGIGNERSAPGRYDRVTEWARSLTDKEVMEHYLFDK